MTKPRVKETDQGIQGEFTVEIYDRFQRKMRDKGWIEPMRSSRAAYKPATFWKSALDLVTSVWSG